MSPESITGLFVLLSILPLVTYSRRVADRGNSALEDRVSPGVALTLASAGALVAVALAAATSGAMLLAVGLGTGIVLSLLDPVNAVSLLVANLILRPWEISAGAKALLYLPKGLALLAIVSYGLSLLTGSQTVIRWNRMTTLFTALVAWLLISSLFSAAPSASIDYLLERFVPIGVTVFLISNACIHTEQVNTLRNVVLIAVTGVLAVALLQTLSEPTAAAVQRLHGPGLWGNANDLGSLVAFALPFAVLGHGTRGNLPRSVARWGCIAILLASLWYSQSRGALIGLLAGGASYALFCARSRRSKWILAASSVLLPILFFGNLYRQSEDLGGSRAARWNYAIAGVRMALDRPLFGVGVSNYPALFESYTPSFEEWGERTAHSTWVLVLAESGIFGLVLFALFFTWALRKSWAFRRDNPEVFVSLVAYGVAMSFLSHTYTLLPYLLVSIVLVVERTVRMGAWSGLSGTVRAGVVFALLTGAAASVHPAVAEASATPVIRGVSSGDKPRPGYLPPLQEAIHLSGARGEVLNFQLRIEYPGCVEWSPGEFRSADGAQQDFPLRLFRLPVIELEQRSFPAAVPGPYIDPAIEIRGTRVCPARDGPWLWGEIDIPRGAAPARYTSQLRFGTKSIPFQVTVWPMTIPDRAALPAYAELTPWFSLLGHFGEWRDFEAELAGKYFAAMKQHRLLPLKLVIAGPELSSSDPPRLNLTTFPNEKSSFVSVSLAQRPEWAYFDFPTTAYRQISSREEQRYYRAVEAAVRELGWNGRAIIYLWDEPKHEDFARLISLSRRVKTLSPSLKVLVTTGYDPRLVSSVDIFAPVLDYLDHPDHPGPATYSKLQRQGKEVWTYVSCMSHGCEALADSGVPDFVIERPSSYIRSIPWIAAKYNLNGFLYYHVNNGYQYAPKRDPWESLWDFSGNGDGTLFYPGRAGERGFREETPVASVRLKLWREASYDAEYIRWMNECREQPAWWKREFGALVRSPRDWSRDYHAYRRLRDMIGSHLARISTSGDEPRRQPEEQR